MDIKSGKINVRVSIAFKIITMVMAIFVKRTLIHVCGNEVNGLNALFLSIIGFLSVAELGVGSAIVFCMYKPIVEGDNDKVSALYQLFRKLYLLIGAVIFVGGLAVMPFLPRLAKDYTALNVDMYLTYLLVLISVTLTYVFSSKTSLINAYKNDYITTTITQSGVILQYVLQIAVLLLTHSFVWYLVCRIIAVAAQWIATEIVARKKYSVIIRKKAALDSETKVTVKKNIKAMFIHKIGYVLVNTVDSLVISAFIGVVSLGRFSNYTMILSSMGSVLVLIFTSLTSVVGHFVVKEDKKAARDYYESFHLLNFFIGIVFYFGYYATINSFIAVFFLPELIEPKSVVMVITMNGFVQFVRRSTLMFRDATGAFYFDRWKPLFEGIVNIILSVLLVNTIGITGVILATIITNLTICHVIEPYVVLKSTFSTSPKTFYFKNYAMILSFAGVLFALDSCMQSTSSRIAEMLLNGCISLAFSFALCAVIALLNKKQTVQLVKILRKG